MGALRRWAVGSAYDLAAFRVVVCFVTLLSADVWTARDWAAAAARAPTGWAWASALVPPTPRTADVATVVLLVSAALTLVGWKTRVVAPVAALSAAWLLGVPQHAGQVLHTHHLVWFLVMLAASPCADAWSLDARGREVPAPALAYGVPLRVVWLSIGLVFFFPGVWKLLSQPDLSSLAAWKTFQLGTDPWLLVPTAWWPMLTLVGALSEVAIGPLLLFRRTRAVGVGLALAFHLFVYATLRISFSSLWFCYLAFVPWSDWVRRGSSATASTASSRPALVVGALLLSAQVVTGILGVDDAWPVACYPRFHRPAPREVEWLELREGGRVVFSLAQLRGAGGQRWWGIVAATLENPSPAALRRFHRQARNNDAPFTATRVRRDLSTGDETRGSLSTGW